MTSAPKLLLDEMLSGDIAPRLRANGHDVTAVVLDPALVGTPDEDLTGQLPTGGAETYLRRHRPWRIPVTLELRSTG